MKRLVSISVVSLVLASCGQDAAEVEERNAESTARGEVLGGTISDDMLPLDSVQSQSPPRAGQASGSSDNGDSAPASDPEAQPAPPPQVEPEPAPEPVAAPEPEEESAE